MANRHEYARGILSGRPGSPAEAGAGDRVGQDTLRERLRGLLHVPASLDPAGPMPLLIMLHGAGARAGDVMPMVAPAADDHGVIVLAPDARGATWDVIQPGFGPDVATLDEVLAAMFRAYPIDPQRIAIAGFSDGASYALSLGLANGSLFRDILAFSPGFAAPARTEGRPRIFIAHGREDPVLPFARCGDRLAGSLRSAGYDVEDRPFSGGHVVLTEMVRAAFARFLG